MAASGDDLEGFDKPRQRCISTMMPFTRALPRVTDDVPIPKRGDSVVAERIEEGNMVFVADGEDGIGSVRRVHANHALVIYIENAGDFEIPANAVRAVHSGKVILDLDHLPRAVLEAIGNARKSEYPH